MCTYIFLQKSQLSILGNLSCKLCSASRGGASLHKYKKYNFLPLFTFALQRIKTSNQYLFASVCYSLGDVDKKLFPSPLKYLSFFYNLAPQDLFTYVLLLFLWKNWKRKSSKLKQVIKRSRLMKWREKNSRYGKIDRWINRKLFDKV